MNKSERIGHCLVALPIAHALGSALFLWSYCSGFGANLVMHATISDLVSVSVTDMVSAYLFTLGVPLLVTLVNFATGNTRSETLSGDGQAPALIWPLLRSRLWVTIAIIVPAVVVPLSVFAFSLIGGNPPNFHLLQLGLTLGAILFLVFVCDKLGAGSLTVEALSLVTIFAVALSTSGLRQGYSDRHASYAGTAKSHTSCGTAHILRRLGEGYLAVLPDDRKAIISDECRVRFGIPSAAAATAPAS